MKRHRAVIVETRTVRYVVEHSGDEAELNAFLARVAMNAKQDFNEACLMLQRRSAKPPERSQTLNVVKITHTEEDRPFDLFS